MLPIEEFPRSSPTRTLLDRTGRSSVVLFLLWRRYRVKIWEWGGWPFWNLIFCRGKKSALKKDCSGGKKSSIMVKLYYPFMFDALSENHLYHLFSWSVPMLLGLAVCYISLRTVSSGMCVCYFHRGLLSLIQKMPLLSTSWVIGKCTASAGWRKPLPTVILTWWIQWKWTWLPSGWICVSLLRCFAFAELPWYQRKVAAVLFASPPTATYEEVKC